MQILPLTEKDYSEWLSLWKQYLLFYEENLSQSITELTWQRLLDAHFPYYGYAAHLDDRIVGIIHFTYHPSSWSATDYCYIEDMMVDPSYRRKQIARKLMKFVYVKAKEHGSDKVHWITQHKNKKAQVLYDQIAKQIDFYRYESDL